MTVKPFAQKYYPPVGPNIQPEAQQHFKLLYDAVNDHDQAIVTQQGQIQAAAAAAAAATTTNTTITKTVTQIAGFAGLGNVNNQTGTSYTLQGTDSGALVTFENAGAIAVTLNSLVGTPFLSFLTNYGPGDATLTPSSGTVNGGATFDLPAESTAMVFFDAVDWWATALPLVPQSLAKVAHEWLDSYDATTGLFTQSRPTAADVTNAADVTAANIFALLNTFTDGVKIGSGSSFGELLFQSSTLSLQALIGGTPVILGLQLANTTTAASVVESNTAEVAYGLETVIAGTPYVGVAQVETNAANFISSTNTIEYQIGSQKAGGSSIPPFTFAVGDNFTVTKKPFAVAVDSSTVPGVNVGAGTGVTNYMQVSGNRSFFGYNASGGTATISGGMGHGIDFGVNAATFGAGRAGGVTSAGIFQWGSANQFTIDATGNASATTLKAGNGATGTISLAKLTTGGTNGSITVANGIITAFTNPT